MLFLQHPRATATLSSTAGVVSFLLIKYVIWSTNFDYDFQNTRDALSTLTKVEYLDGEIESFDFIVIGGGTAGGVVASRLSERYSVLVLEAGGNPSPANTAPYLARLFQKTKMDYQYRSTPLTTASYYSDPDKSIGISQGKGLGGSGNLYSMSYVRGNPKDYDLWAELTGNQIWAFDSVLKFFKNVEDYRGPLTNDYKYYHGFGGKVRVEESTYRTPLTESFLSALREKNVQIGDLSSNFGTVFSMPYVTIKNGERVSSYSAFIKPALGRRKLHIYRFSKVLKIHFSIDMRAIGVTYVRHGIEHFVKSKKEVILSAGSINSPRVLMYSGIGPKWLLRKHGIEVLVDLPVGENMQDHVTTEIRFVLNDTASYIMDRDFKIADIAEYMTSRKGILGTPPGNRPAVGFSNSMQNTDKSWPDLYHIIFGNGISCDDPDDPFATLSFPFCSRIAKKRRIDLIWNELAVVKPASNGYVRISSSDPNSEPIINPRYLADDSDLQRLVDGLLFTVDVVESSEALKKYAPKVFPEPLPECVNFTPRSRKYWECHARKFILPGSHYAGTCRMGKDSGDPNTVVDSQLRVRNTKRLRVVDASIMPNIITGNPHNPTIMIAEVASYLILRQWSKTSPELILDIERNRSGPVKPVIGLN